LKISGQWRKYKRISPKGSRMMLASEVISGCWCNPSVTHHFFLRYFMKVKELIEKLSKLNPNLEIVRCLDKYEAHTYTFNIEVGHFDYELQTFINNFTEDDDYTINAVTIK
jgi:hypothetical protein